MSFPVYPADERRRSSIFCTAAFVVSLIELLLAFCTMYWGKAAPWLPLSAFLCAVILALLSWNACTATRRSHERVEILPDEGLLTRYDASGRPLRTIRFADMKDVRMVSLPTVIWAGRAATVRRDPFICVSTALSDASCTDVRENPHCIVFAHSETAYRLLCAALPPNANNSDP